MIISQSSFTEIARLLSDFFRDLDVVPSDVIAGLIMIRKQQKLQRKLITADRVGGVFNFLSGVPVHAKTRFLDAHKDKHKLHTVHYYLDYAMAVYGWPMYMMQAKTTACCRLAPLLSCGCCCSNRPAEDIEAANSDNCCLCNFSAMSRMLAEKNCEIIYSTYHVEIGEPPFLVAIDHDQKSIVISIRGTLSLQDIVTDLNAEGDLIPVEPPQEQWLAHKGMIEAANYIRNQLEQLQLIEKASARANSSYSVVLVGHSLGAGTAAILAIMLQHQKYFNLRCYAYSPPGGLLSLQAAEYSRTFITSVVLGKDVVPRLGLHQMESLRFDLINAIQRCKLPKYRVIGSSVCCCLKSLDLQDEQLIVENDSQSIGEVSAACSLIGGDTTEDGATLISLAGRSEKELSSHPNDTSIALTVHQPLYPPGEIIHIVQNHNSKYAFFIFNTNLFLNFNLTLTYCFVSCFSKS